MYVDRMKLDNGKYRYLTKCSDCPNERWISDIRSADNRCRSCAKKARAFNFCRVWPCRCRHCDKAMMLRNEPKTKDALATCDLCKGKFGGVQMSEENKLKKKVKKSKIKCSECSKKFEPRSIVIKACSKGCSETRRRRIQREKTELKPKYKPNRDFDGVKVNKKAIKKAEEKIVEIKVKKDVFKDTREKQRFVFKDHPKKGLSNDEISEALMKKFLAKGGKASVTFSDSDYLNREGQTDQRRGGSYGY